MGRKKIDIIPIENKKERSITFCKRKFGLLKKASELSILCGVRVFLAFSDMNNDMHIFKNTDDLSLEVYEENLKQRNCNYFKYSNSDYPFHKITEKNRIVKREKQKIKTIESLLGKRTFEKLNLETNFLKSPELSHHTRGIFSDKKIIKSTGFIKTPKKKVKILELPEELQTKLKTFETEIDTLIHNNKNSEEDLITLLTLKQLSTKYFSESEEERYDTVSKTLKKISKEDFIMMLNSIKFKDKNTDMILAYISIINDILLELILTPQNFQPGSFHFGSLIARGGKSIIKIFIYLVKNLFQQIDLFRIQCSNEKSQSVYKLNLDKIQEVKSNMRIIAIEKVIESCIFGVGMDFTESKGMGFRLHESSKSEERMKLVNTLSDGGNGMMVLESKDKITESEKKLGAGSKIENHSLGLIYGGHIAVPKPSKSFEHFDGMKNSLKMKNLQKNSKNDLRKNNDHGMTDFNLNNYVSNLLHKDCKNGS